MTTLAQSFPLIVFGLTDAPQHSDKCILLLCPSAADLKRSSLNLHKNSEKSAPNAMLSAQQECEHLFYFQETGKWTKLGDVPSFQKPT